MVLQEELPLNHEPSLDHWARGLATEDVATGYYTDWDSAYENAWYWLDAEFNYTYEYQEG